MFTFAVAILVLGFLVFIHEFGHFIAAKLGGMRVEEFSIGMGPKIASVKRGDTEYIIGAIPAGGYVSVAGATTGMEEGEDPDDPARYQNRSLIERALFTIAGPFMNIFLTILILTGGAMAMGVAQPDESAPAIIAGVAEGSPAEEVGLLPQDEILAIDGQEVTGLEATNEGFQALDGDQLSLQIRRQGLVQDLVLMPEYHSEEGRYLIGITINMAYTTETQSFPRAFEGAVKMTGTMSTMILDAVGNLLTGEASVSDADEGLTGPVGIVKIIDQSAQEGFWAVLLLMAALSVNLGLLNLLPIPALDGSRLLFLVLEAVRGRPVSSEKEGMVNLTGFIFLMFLMIYVTYNDIVRLIS